MMCVAPERFYYYYVVVEVDDAKICYIFVCFYLDRVSQQVCRDAQMWRQIFQCVPQIRKMSKKYVKQAIFSSFWSFFTLRCAAKLVFKMRVTQAQKG